MKKCYRTALAGRGLFIPALKDRAFRPFGNKAQDVRVTRNAVIVTLRDGRILSTPMSWHEPLAKLTAAQRKKWVILGAGGGIEWPEIGYDVWVESLLAPHGIHCSDRSDYKPRRRFLKKKLK